MKTRIPAVLLSLPILLLALAARAADPAPAAEAPAAEHTPQTHETRGDDYMAEGNLPAALKEYDAGLVLDPGAKTLYLKKGIALYSGRQPLEAIALLDKAVELNRGGDTAWAWLPLYHKAIAQGRSGDIRSAIQSLDESIKLNPNHENHVARAMAYSSMQQPARALADMQAALRLNPGDKRLPPVIDSLEEQVQAAQYAERMTKEQGAQTGESGLVYFELRQGTGKSPAATDQVKVHYHGTLPDGTVFDSSVQRGEPATFPLNGVIPCWTEGLQKMQVGGKAKLVCPAKIAYGSQGAPPTIKPGATLIFEVELLAIE
jgi:FKBP-type peptidyl-prolyl cis-trans isomerase